MHHIRRCNFDAIHITIGTATGHEGRPGRGTSPPTELAPQVPRYRTEGAPANKTASSALAELPRCKNSANLAIQCISALARVRRQ
jgi:hypothetical protein